jgi:hypothetical protein
MASALIGGIVDADPAIVGLVVVAVLVSAVLFVFGRLRRRSDRHHRGET